MAGIPLAGVPLAAVPLAGLVRAASPDGSCPTTYGESVPLVLAAGSLLDTDAFGVIDAAAAAGFDGVGLRMSGVHGQDPAEIAAAARSLGLIVHDVEVHRIGTDAHAEPLLDAAAEVGARAVLVVSDLTDPTATVDAVGELVVLAGERDLAIGLEYMSWTDPASPHDAVAIAAATGSSLVVDVLHHTRVGAGPAELTAIVDGGHLGWMQLCDAAIKPPTDLLREARHERLAPGDGALPLAALLATVPADTAISVEVQSDVLLAVSPTDRARWLYDRARTVVDTRLGER